MKHYIFTLLISIILFSCKNEGCTDPLAINFDESSNKNDGSCQYSSNCTSPNSPLIRIGSSNKETDLGD